jgi:hypothetical protein
MSVEARKRRVRHAPPEPRVRRIVLTDTDYLLFEALARHGPLPSSYLYEFTRHRRKDRTHLQNRLTEFYNGDARGSLLVRPPQQFAAYAARYQHLVYGLASRAENLLAERGGDLHGNRRRGDPFVHRLMVACVSASFELAAAANDLRYISFEEILDHPRCGTARDSGNPLALSIRGNTLVPDIVFGLEYPGAGFRFFAVECDRNTESIERGNLRQSAYGRKLQAYAAVLSQQTYRAWWGLPNLHVLTVTTNAAHARNILEFTRARIDPRHHPLFGIAVSASFGTNWRVPQAVLSSLLTSPWRTPVGQKDVSKA